MANTIFDYVPDKKEESVTVETVENQENKPVNDEPAQEPSTGTSIVTLGNSAVSIVELFQSPDAMDRILDGLEKEMRSIDLDVSTQKGRKEIASLARKIASSKTGLDNAGKALGAEYREKIAAINTERNRGVERLQKLQDDIRAPLTEYENKERERVQMHEGALQRMAQLIIFPETPSYAIVNGRMKEIDEIYKREWEEFTKRASENRDEYIEHLKKLAAERKKAEDEAAEAAQKAKAEQERIQREKEEADKRAADAEKKRIENHQKNIDRLSCMDTFAGADDLPPSIVIEARIQSVHNDLPAIDWEEFSDKANEAAEAVLKSLDVLLAQAREKEKTLAEEKRLAIIAAEKKAEQEAEAKRAADKAHKARINNTAAACFLAAIHAVQSDELTAEEASKKLVEMIAKGQIPNVSIRY